jgi:acyl dehydratase
VTTSSSRAPVGEAPYFDDLVVGQVERAAPALTLTSGLAAQHMAILGDRCRLALDADLCRRVLGGEGTLANPGLVCDIAIGQSTLLTQRVIGNLFYRGLAFRRHPRLGDTLRTSTEVVALRRNRPRPGRAETGLAALRITTRDQCDRPVLDFWRCAMLPTRDASREMPRDDLGLVGGVPAADPGSAIGGWDLALFRSLVPGPHFEDLVPFDHLEPSGGDVVSAAPELARLTLNVAAAHHDETATAAGRRLVYGGHTIGIAAAHLTRALPSMITIAGWHSCDHLGPVYEGDTLHTALALERTEPLAGGGGLAHLRARVTATREGERLDVLDWRLAGVFA